MNVGFIGIGNMGGAILGGMLKSGAFDGKNILLCGRDYEKTCLQAEEYLEAALTARELGECNAAAPVSGAEDRKLTIEVCESVEELVRDSDVVFLGVEPKTYEEIMPQVASAYEPDKLLISMAAGITIEKLRSYREDAKFIRIMPNTPAQVGEVMTSMSRSGAVSDEEMDLVKSWFDSIGRAEEVPEDLIHAVIGVSGSSPAYTYLYIKGLAQAAETAGMNKKTARVFAAQAVLGAAKMVLSSDEDLDALVDRVATPGGTTIEAVNFFREKAFSDLVSEGAKRAIDRSQELSQKATSGEEEE